MEQEEVWNAIAGKWAEFRVRPTEEVVDFLSGKSGKVLDLGCGSGRNCLDIEGLDFYGVDFSEKLLEIAKAKNYVEVKKGDVSEIPYDDEVFDYVVFVRALHCVEGAGKRRKALRECFRVLKKDGEMMVSVWGRGSGRVKNRGKESFVPWTVPQLDSLGHRTGQGKVLRYTYLYDVEELRKELEDVGFEVERVEVGKNIVFVVGK